MVTSGTGYNLLAFTTIAIKKTLKLKTQDKFIVNDS